MMANKEEMEYVWKVKTCGSMPCTHSHTHSKVLGLDSRVRLGGVGSYLEVRLGQWQQENGLGHGWVAGLEDGQQEGRSLSLQDIRETVVWDRLP